MAFNGVRISWLILARKADLERSAFSAFSRALFNSASAFFSRVISCTVITIPSLSSISMYSPETYVSHSATSPLLSRISSIASKSVKLLLARNVSSIFFRIGQLPQSSCVPQPPSADNALLQRNKSPTRANLPSGLRALVIS